MDRKEINPSDGPEGEQTVRSRGRSSASPMEWKEISRTPVPFSVRLYPGLEGANSAYALACYTIKSYRVCGNQMEWRTVTEETPKLLMSEHPELQSDFRDALLALSRIEMACFCLLIHEGPETIFNHPDLKPTPETEALKEALIETRNVARSFWKSLIAHDERARHDYETWVGRCPWLDEDYEETTPRDEEPSMH